MKDDQSIRFSPRFTRIFPQVDPSGDSDFSEIYHPRPRCQGVAAAIDRYGLAEFPKLSAEEHGHRKLGPPESTNILNPNL